MIRDSQGLVIASLVQQVSQAYKSVEIEVMAPTRALEFGLEMGIDKAVVEGDSAIVFHALEKKRGMFGSLWLAGQRWFGYWVLQILSRN